MNDLAGSFAGRHAITGLRVGTNIIPAVRGRGKTAGSRRGAAGCVNGFWRQAAVNGVDLLGIYRFDGPALTICVSELARPTDFKNVPNGVILILKRKKP